MRASKLFAPTLREVPAEAEVVSHQLMLRAGMLRKAAGGIYNYLPLTWRVLKKIEAIVREEMDESGGQELLMPIIQPAEMWQETLDHLSSLEPAIGDIPQLQAVRESLRERLGRFVNLAAGQDSTAFFASDLT